MSYAGSEALQRAVYQRLIANPGVTAQVGTEIYDAAPPIDAAAQPEVYIHFGSERVRDVGSQTSRSARHDFSIFVQAGTTGFLRAKAAAGAVCDALIDAEMPLSRGELVGLSFVSAEARRGPAPTRRQIELRFRATIDGL